MLVLFVRAAFFFCAKIVGRGARSVSSKRSGLSVYVSINVTAAGQPLVVKACGLCSWTDL